MAVLCLWLGWGLYKVRPREGAVQYLNTAGANVSTNTVRMPWRLIPLSWRLLGAEPVSSIHVYGGVCEDYDREHIRALFPEADIDFPD
jgi:hypothetical protein